MEIVIGALIVLLTAAAGVAVLIRARNMQRWIGPYLFPRAFAGEARPRRSKDQPVDVYLAICDHFEPECYGADRATAVARVQRWVLEYPQRFGRFTDSDGRPPQHTFFFPQDEYRPEYLDDLKLLCDLGFGDVDVHLHHHDDTPEGFREKMESFRDSLFYSHGLLRRDPVNGRVVYGFIHGNWALCNSRPDGLCCGVDHELTILRETGCYADFTMPSAPSATQTRTINSIYYAQDLPGRRMSHNVGTRARAGVAAPKDHLLMIQGPLCLDWQRRKHGLIPRIENADLHGGRPPSLRRFQKWLDCGVHVAGRPDQVFVKLHTHGCKDGNIDTLLGPETQQFHADLAAWAAEHPHVRYHYVTAWEMALKVREIESQSPASAMKVPQGQSLSEATLAGVENRSKGDRG